MQDRLGTLKAAAAGRGIALTHQRLEIFREVAESEDHPDAEKVFRAVRGRLPSISLDTVYRTLSLLRELKLINAIGVPGAGLRYDGNVGRHHHYVCISCGMIVDFEDAALDALNVPDAVGTLGSVENSHVEVRGVCTACQAAGKDGAVHRDAAFPPGNGIVANA